ncbi:MAG: hypothetical protein ACR2MM_08610 [Flavobacteriaceae bacterium]
MRLLLTLFGVLILCSCNWLTPKEEKTRKLVQEELRSINWNDVDQYPLFQSCGESISKEEQRICFENELLNHFSRTLEDFEFVLSEDVEDTIYVDFLVERDGSITVLDIEDHMTVQNQIPEFDAVITQSLKSLPQIEPALKRGIPVNAKFRIPLELNTN